MHNKEAPFVFEGLMTVANLVLGTLNEILPRTISGSELLVEIICPINLCVRIDKHAPILTKLPGRPPTDENFLHESVIVDSTYKDKLTAHVGEVTDTKRR